MLTFLTVRTHRVYDLRMILAGPQNAFYVAHNRAHNNRISIILFYFKSNKLTLSITAS